MGISGVELAARNRRVVGPIAIASKRTMTACSSVPTHAVPMTNGAEMAVRKGIVVDQAANAARRTMLGCSNAKRLFTICQTLSAYEVTVPLGACFGQSIFRLLNQLDFFGSPIGEPADCFASGNGLQRGSSQ